jgi:hypothetical protein
MRLIARQFAVSALVAGLSSGAAAAPCPSGSQTSQYDFSVNVGFLLGLTFVPHVRFTYGVDLRLGRGPFSGFARVEGHGREYAQYLVGVNYVHHPLQGEVAVAFNGRHTDHDVVDVVDSALGLHLAFGDWNSLAGAQFQGMIPAVGDRRNGDAGMSVFWVVPGGWLSTLSCGVD